MEEKILAVNNLKRNEKKEEKFLAGKNVHFANTQNESFETVLAGKYKKSQNVE